MEKLVVFGIPSLTHSVTLEHYQSVLETQFELFSRGWTFTYIVVAGDQFVAKARSKIASKFLREYPEAQNLFFIDDDVGFSPDAVIRFLECDKDIVCGVYPKKSDNDEWPCEILADRDTGKLIRDGNLCQATLAPTGFMRIKRHVLERMVEGVGIFQDTSANGTATECYDLFQTGYDPDTRLWWGEDTRFCRRWVAMGGEIWVDPYIDFRHRGGKTWAGRFGSKIDSFSRNSASDTQADALMRALDHLK